MADNNQSIFRNLAGQMPNQNKQVVTGLQEAAKTQMQQQLGGAQPMGKPMGIRQIQQAGAQATAAQAQPILQVQQQAQQQAGQIGQMATQQQQADVQKQLQERQFNMQKAARGMENELATLNQGLKARLLDDQFNFQKDELGRVAFNERQLMDYKLATAKSNIEIRETEQKMRQGQQKKLQIYKAAQAKLEQQLKQEFQKGEQEKDQELTKRLAEANRRMKEKIQREQAAARNKGAMFSALTTLAGAAIGVGMVAAGPAGWAVGAKALTSGALTGAAAGSGGGSVLNALFPKL
jgi:3-oxoacyl-ACP reductase-like protein